MPSNLPIHRRNRYSGFPRALRSSSRLPRYQAKANTKRRHAMPNRRNCSRVSLHNTSTSLGQSKIARFTDYDFGPDNFTLCQEETDPEDSGGDDNQGDSEKDIEDFFFHWEDEDTLFSELLEEIPEESNDSKVEHLVNKLQPSFHAHGMELKKEIAETFVPTVNRVKKFYQVLDDKVDISLAKGILAFNSTCKDVEALTIKEYDELKEAEALARKNIEDLFVQLKEAYKRREQLWTEHENSVDAIVEPILESLKALPRRIDSTITNLEKHARKLEKNDDATERVKILLDKIS